MYHRFQAGGRRASLCETVTTAAIQTHVHMVFLLRVSRSARVHCAQIAWLYIELYYGGFDDNCAFDRDRLGRITLDQLRVSCRGYHVLCTHFLTLLLAPVAFTLLVRLLWFNCCSLPAVY